MQKFVKKSDTGTSVTVIDTKANINLNKNISSERPKANLRDINFLTDSFDRVMSARLR